MCGLAPVALKLRPAILDSQDVKDNCESAAGDDDRDDPGDDRRCRRVAHGRRAIAALKTAQTTGRAISTP